MVLAGEERGDPQVLAQIRAELWLDRSVAGAISALDGQRVARRSRLFLAHPPAGAEPDRDQAAGDVAVVRHGVRIRGGDRRAGRDRRGSATESVLGLSRQRDRPRRLVDADLLAWHHVDPVGVGRSRLAAAIRLRAADRGLAAIAGDHDHAGLRAWQRDRRDPDAAHPRRDADRAGPGLCAHRARQGPARDPASCCATPCATR